MSAITQLSLRDVRISPPLKIMTVKLLMHLLLKCTRLTRAHINRQKFVR